MMRLLRRASIALSLVVLLPFAISCARFFPPDGSWRSLPRHSTGLAPDPATENGAVVQIFAARTVGWRGIVATHPWIIVKRAGEPAYRRYDVVGWGNGPKLRQDYAVADGLWFGAQPDVLVDLRGAEAEAIIEPVLAAIESYPYKNEYRTWPGPNSNTFIAHVGREVPELKLDLPPTAIGKDYRPLARPVGHAPSGGGVQLSLFGLAGIILAPEEGIEVNLFSLSLGIDVLRPALRLPFLGRVGVDDATQAVD
jgi:hypothetical protein